MFSGVNGLVSQWFRFIHNPNVSHFVLKKRDLQSKEINKCLFYFIFSFLFKILFKKEYWIQKIFIEFQLKSNQKMLQTFENLLRHLQDLVSSCHYILPLNCHYCVVWFLEAIPTSISTSGWVFRYKIKNDQTTGFWAKHRRVCRFRKLYQKTGKIKD